MDRQSPLDAFDRRNLLTYASLFCGVAAVAAARAASAPLAGLAMAMAVIFDTYDGRFAQIFASDRGRKQLGAQLDSLSDAATFGAVPVLCAMLLTDAHGDMAWLIRLAGFAYAACAITRLAFFNVHTIDAGPAGFVGVPVPVAALIWASVLLTHPPAVAVVLVLCGAAVLMVAPLRIARPTGLGLIVFTCWPVVIAIGHLLRWSA
jgi:phosphatidylserine synthase